MSDCEPGNEIPGWERSRGIMNDADPDDGPLCCMRAVFDNEAGWWCPVHGDEMEMRLDVYAPERPGEDPEAV